MPAVYLQSNCKDFETVGQIVEAVKRGPTSTDGPALLRKTVRSLWHTETEKGPVRNKEEKDLVRCSPRTSKTKKGKKSGEKQQRRSS